ncbi:Tir chaperone protein (CesT) [Variovorax sp. PBS-H4]|uniref:CesT family type III secretion system chaperone n=1 Tax=Variovorax sp. PBS-H4 TaxID=434008 RepID=UPI0013194D7C|nr:CesT family type III secretion system chaperone [Variovorax sp. PBS-H4]VTU27074.1 Tir chaperone protein (CesT) [Variovorax sp. PBS-H4]
MSEATGLWRSQFIDIALDLRRQAGKPATHFQDAPDAAIRMKFHIEGVMFQVTHLAGANTAADRFLLECHFGPLAMDRVNEALVQALSLNLGMARSSSGVLGIDESLDHLVYSCFVSLHGATGANISEALRDLAQLAHEWRAAHSITLH